MLQEEELSLVAKHDAVKTILVVEDDDNNRELYTLAFSLLTRYHVRVVRNSTEALDFVKHIKPSLFILDYRLPFINGIDLYDQLHATPKFEDIPAIIISSITSDEVTREIESRKLICIDKPFDLDELLDTIAQALA